MPVVNLTCIPLVIPDDQMPLVTCAAAPQRERERRRLQDLKISGINAVYVSSGEHLLGQLLVHLHELRDA